MRKYKSGMKWCVWRWKEHQSGYIDRLHIVQTPWGALCLHLLNYPDQEPWLHDHPVTFLSLILSGGYTEKRGVDCWQRVRGTTGYARVRGVVYYYHRWLNFIRATDTHTITKVEPHTVTIAFMGPKVREWGFHTPEGWVYWKDYYAQQRLDTRPT